MNTMLDELNLKVSKQLARAQLSSSRPANLFIGEMLSFAVGESALIRLRSNACSLTSIGSGPGILLVAPLLGKLGVSQHQSRNDLLPGDLSTLDLAQPWEILFHGLCEVALLATARLPNSSTIDALKIPASNVAGSVLRELMITAFSEVGIYHCTPPQAQAIESTFRHLLQGATGYLAKVGSSDWDRLVTDRQRIDLAIKENLRNPRLGPGFLAELLGLSRRKLYRVFDGDEGGISQHIRRLRLQMIAQDLQDPLLNDLGVAAIAKRWGMADSCNFSRMFRKQFSITPGEMRRSSTQVSADSRRARR